MSKLREILLQKKEQLLVGGFEKFSHLLRNNNIRDKGIPVKVRLKISNIFSSLFLSKRELRSLKHPNGGKTKREPQNIQVKNFASQDLYKNIVKNYYLINLHLYLTSFLFGIGRDCLKQRSLHKSICYTIKLGYNEQLGANQICSLYPGFVITGMY